MIASLPMYDLPEVRDAIDAWWRGIATALRAEGVADVPESLARDSGAGEHWRSPELLLSQCCGYPLTHDLREWLEPVATLCYRVPGCEGPHYASAIVVGAECHASSLGELRGGVAAFSARHSHSGYNVFRAAVAPLAGGRPFFARAVQSGSHLESIALVARAEADVATVDCVTYALLERYRPQALAGVRTMGFTERAPGLPYVTRAGAGPELRQALARALERAVADPSLAEARSALFIDDVAFLGWADYARIDAIESRARALGYPELV